MKDKCEKFEGLFVFGNQNDLKEHVENCPDCKLEQEQFDKISALIQKAKPFYQQEKAKKRNQLKVACALFLMVLGTSTFSLLNYDNALVERVKYGQTLCAEDLGFPVDSYGLIMVDE